MAKQVKNNRKLKIFEIIWYSLCGALALWGLTYIVLDLIAENIDVLSSENELLKFTNAIKNTFGLSPFYWGMIIFAIGALLAVIVLLVCSKKADRDFEKEQRRAAIRASTMKSIEEEVIDFSEEERQVVVEEPKEEPAPVEEPKEEVKEEPAPVEEAPKAEEPVQEEPVLEEVPVEQNKEQE